MAKLYQIEYLLKKRGGTRITDEEYIISANEEDASALFIGKYPQRHIQQIRHVPSDREIRWPLIWVRIGKAAAEKQRHADRRWLGAWVKCWDDIADTFTKRERKRYENWIQMWNEIGIVRWDNRSRFDFLEID